MNHPDTNSVTDAAQLKADIVLLIDLITEHSRKVELVTHEDLRDEFLSKAPMQQPIPVSQIKAEYEAIPEMERKLRNKADDSPEEKERRRLISRRQMFGSLFSGELSLADLKEEPAEAEPAPREITPEYFETVWQKYSRVSTALKISRAGTASTITISLRCFLPRMPVCFLRRTIPTSRFWTRFARVPASIRVRSECSPLNLRPSESIRPSFRMFSTESLKTQTPKTFG